MEPIVKAALAVHTKVATTFLPTAVKFHYIFNLRDLSNIFQGILFSAPEAFKTPLQMCRLYMHEATRVYSDKLTEEKAEFKIVRHIAYGPYADEISPFGQKSPYCDQNRNVDKKSKFWPKIEILSKNRNFGQKSKFCQKIEMLA